MKKLILVFSGPSGAGKSTLINYLLENLDSVGLTVSHTTRAPRKLEKSGVDYHFVSHDEFERMASRGDFIEHVSCYGNRYGTSKKSVENVLDNKDICILDLEFEGAHGVLENKTLESECIGILVLPPSLKTLKQRLSDRKTETEESLNTRLIESFKVDKIAKYHHVIINRNLEDSKRELIDIVKSHLQLETQDSIW